MEEYVALPLPAQIEFTKESKTVNGKKLNGGTTIAGTLVLAHLAGIHIFATGGLGGVHRGGESSLDISADLTELGRTPVALVSSGCKSFLDIPRTLEYLETQGVSVSTFADGREGQIDFPAFWTRDSGVPSPMVVRDEHEAAAIIRECALFLFGSRLEFFYNIFRGHAPSFSQSTDQGLRRPAQLSPKLRDAVCQSYT